MIGRVSRFASHCRCLCSDIRLTGRFHFSLIEMNLNLGFLFCLTILFSLPKSVIHDGIQYSRFTDMWFIALVCAQCLELKLEPIHSQSMYVGHEMRLFINLESSRLGGCVI